MIEVCLLWHEGVQSGGGGRCQVTIVRIADTIDMHYYTDVIRSFRSAETETIFNGNVSRKFPRDIQSVARRKLMMVHVMVHGATNIMDLKTPPANRLEKLTGDRNGQWSIRVNDQYRICFEWGGADAKSVEMVDYH